MIDPDLFQGLHLRGGFVLVRVETVAGAMFDAVGRPALAHTQIVGRSLNVSVLSGLDDKETSVTLYHEILEAITVGSATAPEIVQDFNEADFDAAACHAHEHFGPASPEGLNRMLQFYGFCEN